MTSKMSSGANILKEDGVSAFLKRASVFLAEQTPIGRKYKYALSLREIKSRMDEEENLSDILDTILDIKPGYPPYRIASMQLRDEIGELAMFVGEEQPQTVLEIGTAQGGSLYIWSRYFESVDTIISLDMPGGKFGGGYEEDLMGIFRKFSPSKEMHFVRQNSHKYNTFRRVSEMTGKNIDFLFIDGDHTYDGVKQDFEMYSRLVADGGIIALHDIVNHPDDKEVVDSRRNENIDNLEDQHISWGESHPDCNVDDFWEELVSEYVTREIISHPQQTWGGIGIVRK